MTVHSFCCKTSLQVVLNVMFSMLHEQKFMTEDGYSSTEILWLNDPGMAAHSSSRCRASSQLVGTLRKT